MDKDKRLGIPSTAALAGYPLHRLRLTDVRFLDGEKTGR